MNCTKESEAANAIFDCISNMATDSADIFAVRKAIRLDGVMVDRVICRLSNKIRIDSLKSLGLQKFSLDAVYKYLWILIDLKR